MGKNQDVVTLYLDFIEDGRTSMEVYTRNLAAGLREVAGNRFNVCEYRPKLGAMTSILPEVANIRMRLARYVSYPIQARKRQGTLNHIIDHGYAHLLKYLDPTKTIVTVHDLIPLLRWKGVIFGSESIGRPWLNEWTFRHLKKARHLIAISKNTKADLIQYCGCNEGNITVVYYGVDPRFTRFGQLQRVHSRRSFGFQDLDSHLVLITGDGFYKNHLTSLKVFELLQSMCKRPVKLVRLGRPHAEWTHAVSKSGLKRHVIELEFLPSDRMADLYNSVDCLLFPSLYEGFGWPPLEAMACGTPVVTSNAASLPEVVGDAGFMLAPDDVEGLAHAVHRMLEDPNVRETFVQRGLGRARCFNWGKNLMKTLKIYEQIAIRGQE